jgi:hypothetical protein
LGAQAPPLPPPPPPAGPGAALPPPPPGLPRPQANDPARDSLGGNLTSASKSGSEVMVLTQGDRGEYFWLYSASLRGQAAELVTSALLYSAIL